MVNKVYNVRSQKDIKATGSKHNQVLMSIIGEISHCCNRKSYDFYVL